MSRCLVIVIAFVGAVMAFNRGKCGVAQQEIIEQYHQQHFKNLNEMDCKVVMLVEEDDTVHHNCTFSAEIGRVGRYNDHFSRRTISKLLDGFEGQIERIEECTKAPGATYGCATTADVLKIWWGWRGNSYNLKCIYVPASPVIPIKCMKRSGTKAITKLWEQYRQGVIVQATN